MMVDTRTRTSRAVLDSTAAKAERPAAIVIAQPLNRKEFVAILAITACINSRCFSFASMAKPHFQFYACLLKSPTSDVAKWRGAIPPPEPARREAVLAVVTQAMLISPDRRIDPTAEVGAAPAIDLVAASTQSLWNLPSSAAIACW